LRTRRYAMGSVLTSAPSYLRDIVAVVSLVVVCIISRRNFYFRGLTYRSSVLPLWKERVFVKLPLYLSILGIVDMVLRLGRLPLLVRMICCHVPFLAWAIMNPLSQTTRDDHGWSDTATRARIWHWIAKMFGPTQILLSEEWRDLSDQERSKWTDRHYVVGMHPHGLLPMGAILVGLTWVGGGLKGITTSGAKIPEPSNPGSLLHQRFFRKMKLRAAVATGACGLFPGFFEMFTKLGAFECTKPFVVERLREDKDVAIFAGGAQESVFATPGRYVCYIKHRGFARLALEERRDILPMWCFGDESIVPQARNPPDILKRMVKWAKEASGLAVPPLFGGLPRLFCGLPLTLVTGVPVSLEDLWPATVGGDVNEEAVTEAVRRYMAALKQLFDRNKALVPGGHQDGVIEFVYEW